MEDDLGDGGDAWIDEAVPTIIEGFEKILRDEAAMDEFGEE